MSDTPPKLPGLSRLTEAELRSQYETETGQSVPDELSTVVALRDALKAHRATQGHDDEPEHPAAPEQPFTPEVLTLNPEVLPVVFDVEGLLRFAESATTGELHELHGVLVEELRRRGEFDLLKEPAPAAPVSVKEAVPMVQAINDAGEEREFTAQSWDLLGNDKAGWKLAIPKPTE